MAERLEVEIIPKVTQAALAVLKGELGTALGIAGGAAGGGVGAAVSALGGLFDAIKELAEVASPAVMEQFNLVFRDAMAIVGRLFVPLFQKLTEIFRVFADFLAAILPSTDDMRSIFAALNPLIEELRALLTALAPVFQVLIRALVQLFALLLRIVAQLATALIRPLVALLRALGLAGPELPSSVGASGRRAAFVDVAAYGQQARIAAASLPRTDPQREMADSLKRIELQVGTIEQNVQRDPVRDANKAALDPYRA